MQSTYEPQCGMWCIQATITKDTGKGTISPQVATFYLHPECNAGSKQAAIDVATKILNPFDDPKLTPNVSAHLVDTASVAEGGWSVEELEKMDPEVNKLF